MKKQNNSWKEELIDRIKLLAGENEAAFAKKAGIGDQAFRKYLKGSVPGGENILKIAVAGNRSTDWLLTGKEKLNISCPVNCDDEIRELCAEVKEIIKSKTHWANSLESNIHSFKAGVDKDKNESKKAKPIPAPHQPTKKQHGKKKVA